MSPAISTTTVTVNAAFLQEIKQVNEELWQTLREVRQRAESQILQRADAWKFLHQLAQLRDQLAFHFGVAHNGRQTLAPRSVGHTCHALSATFEACP